MHCFYFLCLNHGLTYGSLVGARSGLLLVFVNKVLLITAMLIHLHTVAGLLSSYENRVG